MSGTRKEQNRLRAQQDIEQAFLSLYKKSGIEGVSVSKICQICGLSRSSFYLYYDDKYEILQAAENRLHDGLWAICGQLPDQPQRCRDSLASKTLQFIRANIEWYEALLGDHGDPRFLHKWHENIIKSLQPKLKARNISAQSAAVRSTLFSSALTGLYTYIIFKNPDISDEVVSEHMVELLVQLLR